MIYMNEGAVALSSSAAGGQSHIDAGSMILRFRASLGILLLPPTPPPLQPQVGSVGRVSDSSRPPPKSETAFFCLLNRQFPRRNLHPVFVSSGAILSSVLLISMQRGECIEALVNHVLSNSPPSNIILPPPFHLTPSNDIPPLPPLPPY